MSGLRARAGRASRWLLSPMTARPCRLTVLAWSLLWLFSPGINHLLLRYNTVIMQVLDVVIPVGVLALAARFITLWRQSERRL